MFHRILALVALVLAIERSQVHVDARPAIDGSSSAPANRLDSTAGSAKPTTGGVQPPAVSKPAAAATRGDSRRPIWALSHMVNSIKELDYRLK
jgi:hypothetical protein